jgi:hypothetical protein
MKWTTAHFRATAYAAGFLFLVVCAWSLLEVSRVRQLRLAIATRQRDVDVLRGLFRQSRELDSRAESWAVSGATSFEIRESISRTFPRVTFVEPQVAGAFRLNQAEIVIAQEKVETFLKRLGDVQGLRVRLIEYNLLMDDRNLATASVTVAWLERF